MSSRGTMDLKSEVKDLKVNGVYEEKTDTVKYEKYEFCDTEIRMRKTDGYYNANDMTYAGGKLWKNYKRNKETTEFLNELENEVHIRATLLVQSTQGGDSKNQGTWIHPRVAIHLAHWISPKFAVKVTDWVFRYLNGDLSLATEIVERHGAIKDEDEKVEARVLERKLRNLGIEYQEMMDEKNGIIKDQKNTIDEMNKKLDYVIAQNNNLLLENKALNRKTSEVLLEIQGANDSIDDLKQMVVGNAPFHTHVPANENKREVMIINRTNDTGATPWHYYIACVKKDGIKQANARALIQFPMSTEIHRVEYVPNARHMLEELVQYMGNNLRRRSSRVRVCIPMTEQAFLQIVEEVHRLYITRAVDATDAAENKDAAE